MKLKKLKMFVAGSTAFFVMLGGGVAYASHQFTDVPNSSPWHDNVDWLVDRSITTGCGGGNYCPTDGVTRGQMAAFMQRLGNVLTPKIWTQTGFEAGPTGSANVHCTVTVPSVAYERQAVTESKQYGQNDGTGLATMSFRNVYSTNGGATWTDVTGAWSIATSNTDNNEFMSTTSGGAQAMDAGATYMFGIRTNTYLNIDGQQGCALTVQVFNRQPGTVIETSGAPSGSPDAING